MDQGIFSERGGTENGFNQNIDYIMKEPELEVVASTCKLLMK
jgi:hypothetical protein